MFKNGQKRNEGGLCSSICPLVSLSVNRWRHYISPLQASYIRKINSLTPFFYPLGHSNLITCLTSFFGKKNPVRLQKKKKKKSTSVSYGRKWLKNFLSDSKKKKKKCKL